MNWRNLLFIAIYGITGASYAGGIKGQIINDEGLPLAYATIFVKQTGSGGVSGMDGNYEVTLAPGTYDITYQYLGYETTIIEDQLLDYLLSKNSFLYLKTICPK